MSGKTMKKNRKLLGILQRSEEVRRNEWMDDFITNVKSFGFVGRVKLCWEILTIHRRTYSK